MLQDNGANGSDELGEACQWQSKVAPLIRWQSF